MNTEDMTTPQRVLLRRLARQKLYRAHDGEYWLHPAGLRNLPEPVFPGDVEPLLEAGVLVAEESPSQWLGLRIIAAEQEAAR